MIIRLATLSLLLASGMATAGFPGQDRFVSDLVHEGGFQAEEIEASLAQARRLQSILDAIARPAEAKPWRDYRPIFITTARIEGGHAFMREHREVLARVERDTGVPASLVTAIIGVESNYGRVTGSYRVLDALATLAFHYPPRADFFRGELGQLFHLVRDEGLMITELKGSYAGAMGWGQFIPSSYRRYAVDGDGDGRRDLWNSIPDIVASVANYFVEHGWAADGPVVAPARADDRALPFERDGNRPISTVGDLRTIGYPADHPGADQDPATLLVLDGEAGPEHWLTFHNFYVITRYNRSPLYAMAVHQLASELAIQPDQGLARY